MSTNNNYIQKIHEINTIDELNKLKIDFINECQKRENKIKVSDMLNKATNFCGAKHMFESIIPKLMSNKKGKKLIKKYINTIKENKSIKKIYAYYEGLKNTETPESKKTYIIEALSITKPINHNEYLTGVNDIINILSESFKLLGDEYVLNNIKPNNESILIDESLQYLSTTKKNLNNLNEYFTHINRVTNNLSENQKPTINLDSTLEDIVSNMKTKISESNIDNIFNTENKEKAFIDYKQNCMEMILKQKSQNTDKNVLNKLTEIEEKLKKKEYIYETYTKDMFYMKELLELLK